MQNTSKVTNQIFLSEDSEICGQSEIKGSASIQNGSRIFGQVIIDGNPVIKGSTISGYAKIKGRSNITNSVICQASVIESMNVSNSHYYCQTEDYLPPYPKNPKGSLLGTDADGDGVRDDIENYIVNYFSNKKHKNYSSDRNISKLYAKILQKEFLFKSNFSSLKNLNQLKAIVSKCYSVSITKDLYAEFYDTDERLFTLFDILGKFHGQKSQSFSGPCPTIKNITNMLSSIK